MYANVDKLTQYIYTYLCTRLEHRMLTGAKNYCDVKWLNVVKYVKH